LGDAANLVRAGHFTRQMAVPWQADFLQCKAEDDNSGVFPGSGLWGWWPGQRPDWVFISEADFKSSPRKPVRWHRATRGGVQVNWPSGSDFPSYAEMIDKQYWRGFGFVLLKNRFFLEDPQEREQNLPP